MPKHNHDAERKNDSVWKMNNRAKQDHADANRPNHLHDENAKREVKRPRKRDDHKLDKNQPHAALEEKRAEFAFGFSQALQEHRRAREKNKHGRAEMRNPPCEVKSNGRSAEIEWVMNECIKVKEIACVVECHNNHNRAAQQIERIDSALG